jgi:signal transduction histidine kinase
MRRRLISALDPAIALIALLLAVNLVAVFGLVSSRRDVRAALAEQRALETRADARTFEALLAQLHADLAFLARTAPLATMAGLAASEEESDPVRRRWARLDVESSLLLFLQSRPAVRQVTVTAAEDELRAVARWEEGVPQLAPPDASPPSEGPPDDPELLSAVYPLGEGAGELCAWVDPAPLLATTGEGLELRREPPTVAEQTRRHGELEAISSALWQPPFEAWIERGESDRGVLRAVEHLADRYGWTLGFNVLVIPLSLVLAGVTLRRVRRVARLEAEAAHRARVQALESQVRHAERLASLGRFAAGIAHEINNPLEGMANYLDLLRDDLERGELADASRWVPRLREGIDRAAGTVQQVLRLAEPGRGEHRELELAEVVEGTLEFLRGHPDCRSATLTSRVPRPLTLRGDPQTLGQLLLNLVLNACQAQPEGGEVEVLAATATASEGEGEGVELRVRDRGKGVEPEAADHLFEPFFSTRGSLGLGLAVCEGIVLQHGGWIRLAGRADGPGAEVRVWLPVGSESEER